MKKASTAAIALVVLALAAPAGAQVKSPGGGEARGGPISISADRLETDDVTGEVLFSGAVLARQGSLTLTCDQLKIFYTPPEGEDEAPTLAAGGREIDRVEGFGRVKMVDGDNLAVGDHALYLARSTPRRLILTGEARVWQGRDSLTGHQVTYFLDERRSVAESAPQRRVRTVVHAGEPEAAPQ